MAVHALWARTSRVLPSRLSAWKHSLMQMECDVSVIGGGVAGACAALECAKSGLPVILVEANREMQWRIGETLGPESKVALLSLGLWDEFNQAGHLPSHGNASAWGWGGLAEKDFIFNPHGNAWQLDRVAFEEMLTKGAEKAEARIVRGQAVTEIERSDSGWKIKLVDRLLCSRSIIDATGRRSMVARAQGVKREILDQLVAVYSVATSMNGKDQDSRTFIESGPDGWWYTAVMPGGRRTVSFQTDADLLPGQEWRTREWFLGQLRQTRHVSGILEDHGYEFISPPQLTSAHSGRMERFSGDGWLAVGDAAMSFDPLSGQGILKAMQSGMMAAEVVANGTPESQAGFDRWNEQLWSQFSKSRNSYYAMEQRWPDSAFWQRRGSRNEREPVALQARA